MKVLTICTYCDYKLCIIYLILIDKNILAYIKGIVNIICNKNTHKSAFFYTGVIEKLKNGGMLMLTNLYLDCELYNNRNKILIGYNTEFDDIHISINDEDLNRIWSEDIPATKDEIKKFGLTDGEISKIMLFRKYNTISHEDIIFKLLNYKIKDAKDAMSKIMTNSKAAKLTDTQIKILKREMKPFIDYNEYIKLSDDDKAAYSFYTNKNNNISENYKFLNELIIKYKSYIANIQLYIVIKDKNAVTFDTAFDKSLINKIKFNIQKQIYSDINYMPYITSVPIIELSNEFADVFKDFEESRFVDGLINNLMNQLKDNIITKYEFKLNSETLEKINQIKAKAQIQILNGETNILSSDEKTLIQMPVEITTLTPDEPNNYILHSQYRDLNDEYKNILKQAKPKTITLNDILYLLKFIENLI